MVINRHPSSTKAEAMSAFHQDGILEIVFGAIMLNMGFDILSGSPGASLFTYIPILLMSSMKTQITITRIGYEPFNGDLAKVRKWNMYYAIGMVVILLVLSTLILGDTLNVVDANPLPFGQHPLTLLEGAVLAIACLAGALLIPLKRLYLYGALALLMGAIGLFFFPPQILAFAFALVILANGARLMIHFSKAYPLPDKDKEGDKKNK